MKHLLIILCIPALLILLLAGSALGVLGEVVDTFDGSPTRRGDA